jgi:Na+-transporting methylmalonyl-CoA/oxaloacetate decarboxylase gamma subunit
MDNWTFGFTLMVVGMGGTMAALSLFAILMDLIKRVFPVKEEQKE